MKQQLDICQEVSSKEKDGLEQEINALKQQLNFSQQQKATSDSLTASLQTQLKAKEQVLIEEKRQNAKLLNETEAKDELTRSLKDQLQSAEGEVTSIRKEQEMEKMKLTRQLEDLQTSYEGMQEQVRTKEKVKGRS